MKRLFICFMFLFLPIVCLSACATDVPATPVSEEVQIWQNAYSDLLREYEEESSLRFLLYDFDKNAIPELIVIGTHADEVCDAVFTFRDGNLLSLEYSDDVTMADFVLYARGGVMPAPDNAQGLISYMIGPSAGAFGASCYYTKIVINGNRLIVDARGKSYIDVDALQKIFDNFGRDTTDYELLNVAIKEHTYYYIDDNLVSSEDFYSMFGNDYEDDELIRLTPLLITESNIQDAIFGY